MHITEFIHGAVLPAIQNCDYVPESVLDGIDAYARDNGFFELDGEFPDTVIQGVILNSLRPLLALPKEHIVLFFSNYRLIEKVRLINNRSLALAKAACRGAPNASGDVQKLEADFDDCMNEVCRIDGLRDFLNVQISEILLNIDFAKETMPYYGQRLHGLKGDMK